MEVQTDTTIGGGTFAERFARQCRNLEVIRSAEESLGHRPDAFYRYGKLDAPYTIVHGRANWALPQPHEWAPQK